MFSAWMLVVTHFEERSGVCIANYFYAAALQGALTNIGYVVAPNPVKNILKRHGIEPAPKREKRTSWKTFLKAHWDVMAATDFFTVEVWMARGLVTYYVLFVMQLKTRCVHIAGVTTAPNGAYMKQVASNLTDVSDGFLLNKAFLLMDRDTKYTEEFRDYLGPTCLFRSLHLTGC